MDRKTIAWQHFDRKYGGPGAKSMVHEIAELHSERTLCGVKIPDSRSVIDMDEGSGCGDEVCRSCRRIGDKRENDERARDRREMMQQTR